MKIFALIAATILYISFAMQHAVQVINYPNHGIQLPTVKVYATTTAETATFPPNAVALK